MAKDRTTTFESVAEWVKEKPNKRSVMCIMTEKAGGKFNGSLLFSGNSMDIGNGIVNLLAQYPQLENVIRDALQEYRHWVITKSASQN